MITVNGKEIAVKSWFGMAWFLSFTDTDGTCWILEDARQEKPGVFTGRLRKADVQRLW